MKILNKHLLKRIWLTLLTIGISIANIAVSLWWNAQVGKIINIINTDNVIPVNIIITAIISITISIGTAYLLSLCSGWTCESLANDLRMGYARHFAGLSITQA